MSKIQVQSQPLPRFSIWEKIKSERRLVSFSLEITARCNNDCRHCYINLSADDRRAKRRELTIEEISRIADEAVSLGALWCLLTGGEPLLREDFSEIYLLLKKKGLLVSVFTNACLIQERHIELFKKYPPRDIEVSVYGVTPKTYEAVTRKKESFRVFQSGLGRLLESGVKVRFKAMAMRSNAHELPKIAEFCRARTKDYFRFDPLLHLRFDGSKKRNMEIWAERLTAAEIVELELADAERFESLQKACKELIQPDWAGESNSRLLRCGAGSGDCAIGYDGTFRLCPSLRHPECVYDLRKGSLAEAYLHFVPGVRDQKSDSREFLDKCGKCPLINLCLWCPAHGYLENGKLDMPSDYFCEVAHARAKALRGLEKRI